VTVGALLLAAALARPAEAEVRRVAVIAANNDGGMVYRPLYFAEDDARKMADVLTSVGGYRPGDVEVVLPATARRIEDAFADARRRVEATRAEGHEVVFLFYYSGHGDEERLLLGESSLEYTALEDLLASTGAEVRLAFLDSCNSGAATRSKGGSRVPAFEFELAERLDAEGTVIITSSTGDEASQESDEIGGSYFTHFLASGLSGAADRDEDGAVTLTEAYAYVYDETVIRTSTTRIGTQHPTFDWELSGEGDLVLAELDPRRAVLELPAGEAGIYAVFDLQRRAYLAEFAAEDGAARIHLRPGRYQVQRRFPTHLQVAEVDVDDGDRVALTDLRFSPLEYEDNIAKGAIEKRIRQARMPDSGVRLAVGVMGPDRRDIAEQYLPDIPVAGVSWRVAWQDGRWLSVDLMAGSGSGTLWVEGVSAVPTSLAATTLGVAAGYATLPRRFQVGTGLRADLLWMGRRFDPSQQIDDQRLVTVAPGVVGWAGLNMGRFQIELEWRQVLVLYALDDTATSFIMHQAILGAGVRF